MEKFNFTFAYLLIIAGLTSNFCFADDTKMAKTEVPKSPFERLIDVDYSFFMTKAKLPWGIDPFQKEPGFVKVDSVEDKFVLEGVFYSKDTQMAIVNGMSVSAGDMVGDRHVEEIGENYVILRKQDSEIELNIPPIRDPASDEDLNDDDDEEDAK